MTDSPTLSVPGPARQREDPGVVPPPLPPDDPEAWYAPAVVAQRAVHPGVVVTIVETREGFDYRVREPYLSADDHGPLETLICILLNFDIVDGNQLLRAIMRPVRDELIGLASERTVEKLKIGREL